VVEPADLSVRDDIRRIETLIADQPVDTLVNNAGFGLAASMLDTDIEDEQRSVDVHISAVLRLTRAALPVMIGRGSGEIVNVSSVSGFLVRGTYGAHKAWVTRFSRSMNAQYGTDDLRIMALCPGLVHTEFHARSGANAGQIPGWMWLKPEDVVREGLEHLRAGRAVSIPSHRYRALVRAAQLAPDRVVARFATFGR
jgi:short-subunit dehydrogenase